MSDCSQSSTHVVASIETDYAQPTDTADCQHFFSICDPSGSSVVARVPDGFLPQLLMDLYNGCDLQDTVQDAAGTLVLEELRHQVTFESVMEQITTNPSWIDDEVIESLDAILDDLSGNIYMTRVNGQVVPQDLIFRFQHVLGLVKSFYRGRETIALRERWAELEAEINGVMVD